MIQIGSITTRPVLPEDNDFSYKVYASTRLEEMQLVDWSPEQQESFLRMQFNAQTRHYHAYYPQAEYQVIQLGDVPVGRLFVERSAESILIMDIALLPEYRNAGIGTTLLRAFMNEAIRTDLPLVLRVEFFNPVIRLYTRLGFVKTREVNSVYQEMVWKPGTDQP
jgi:ribosomal protein S18 acetylase RimI-like enzyme